MKPMYRNNDREQSNQLTLFSGEKQLAPYTLGKKAKSFDEKTAKMKSSKDNDNNQGSTTSIISSLSQPGADVLKEGVSAFKEIYTGKLKVDEKRIERKQAADKNQRKLTEQKEDIKFREGQLEKQKDVIDRSISLEEDKLTSINNLIEQINIKDTSPETIVAMMNAIASIGNHSAANINEKQFAEAPAQHRVLRQ